jgi:uracil phosphoribosyltransferase
MLIKTLGNQNTILDQFIAEVRDVQIQQDSMRFRRNMERIGEIFAYEISKELDYRATQVTTSLGVADVPMLADYPVIATILRAGLPLHAGMLHFLISHPMLLYRPTAVIIKMAHSISR